MCVLQPQPVSSSCGAGPDDSELSAPNGELVELSASPVVSGSTGSPVVLVVVSSPVELSPLSDAPPLLLVPSVP